jgi:hypothetical protein
MIDGREKGVGRAQLLEIDFQKHLQFITAHIHRKRTTRRCRPPAIESTCAVPDLKA